MSLPTAPSRAEADAFTVDDLATLPDDGLRYELLDGTLLVTAAPTLVHQEAALTLARFLGEACPADLHVVVGPYQWRTGRHTAVQPDVLVARRTDLLAGDDTHLDVAPVLVVEVVSPASARTDRLTKAAAYAEAGLPRYWVVDPTGTTVTVTALALADGRYEVEAEASGDATLELVRPFALSFRPAELLAGLRG